MMTITVWLLVVVSDGGYNRGNVHAVDRFPTAEQCEHVRKSMPAGSYEARCIEAKVVRP